MSQFDVAIKLGCTPGAIGQWERYVSAPPVRLIGSMARAYQCSEERIIEAIAEIARTIDAKKPVATSAK